MPNRSIGSAILALAVLAVIWGYNWVVMKVGVQYASPFQFAALRLFFGATSLFALMRLLRMPLRPQEVPLTLVSGLLQTGGVYGLSMWALVSGGAGKTAVLNYTMPFWVLLLAWFILGERIRRIQWLGIGCALTGLLCILVPFQFGSSFMSEAIAMTSGFSWGLGAVLTKKLQQQMPTPINVLSLTAWQMLFGSIPLITIALLIPAAPIAWTPTFIAALLYNIIPGSALASFLWLFSLSRLPAGVAGLGMLAVPTVGVFAAWLQLGEQPSSAEAIGIALILMALLINSLQALKVK